ncbi:uncharacterized protein LOC108249974 isoform X2 [Kryptolebias marmoratus]|uniref:uncharacterized protein LOC108249974 isoform X2 n=1 Tax=Kryptolebias marmoratus TaxID=37003 RepID=UPI000D52F5A7|nr:uncharacterized protein LOC108249974 isoform X2 [Kryptolebias marmoratus]
MKNLLSARCHLERARGTDEENKEYCEKGGDVYLAIGEPVGQGKRNDLNAAVEMLRRSSGNLSEVANEMPATFIRYCRGLSQWVDFARVARQRDYKTDVTVLVGPPGCGKSRRAAGATSGLAFYKSRGEWWDGYVGQEDVIIDDFYGWLKYDELLRICDRYPHRVPVKGSFAQFSARRIFITSNKHVWEWYKFEHYDADPLMRRINTYKMLMTLCRLNAQIKLQHHIPALPRQQDRWNAVDRIHWTEDTGVRISMRSRLNVCRIAAFNSQ